MSLKTKTDAQIKLENHLDNEELRLEQKYQIRKKKFQMICPLLIKVLQITILEMK
jgi:hypothetical protein